MAYKIFRFHCLLALILFLGSGSAPGDNSQVTSPVIPSVNGVGISANLTVAVIDSCCDKPGDANNDMKVGIGDPVYIISYIFRGGPPPPCLQEGDANGDGTINVGDAIYLINYKMRGGPAPICGP